MPSNLIGILGIIVILIIAVLFSSNRKAIHLRVVAAAFVLQAVASRNSASPTRRGQEMRL